MRPIIFTAGILLLVAVWNDFQYQFFLMGGTQTLTTSLYTFTESTSGQAAASRRRLSPCRGTSSSPTWSSQACRLSWFSPSHSVA